MNTSLRKISLELYAFDLRSEKPLRLRVLKGVPQEVAEEKVKEELEVKNYRLQKILRSPEEKRTPSHGTHQCRKRIQE